MCHGYPDPGAIREFEELRDREFERMRELLEREDGARAEPVAPVADD